MRTVRLLLVATILAAFVLLENLASAFSIDSVTLSPGNYVAPWFEVQMTVDISTPGTPALLYQATQVTSNATGLHVDIYPDSGVQTAIGYIRTQVSLGTFQPGTYPYQVVLHPGHEVNWGTRTNDGAFTVVGDVPTVKLTTTSWRTGEPCPYPTCFIAPAVLTIERSEPTNAPVTVYLKVDGTATPGLDYRTLPSQIEIPAGQTTAQIALEPFDDDLAEGPEVVRVALGLSSNYNMLPGNNEVLVVIFDNEPDAPAARLDILSPTNGTHFGFAQTIQLNALAVNASNEVYGPVEFYAGGQMVAHSIPNASTRPAIPGLPSIHTAYWTNPPVGLHAVTARTQLSFSQSITSPPVNIVVEAPRLPLVSLDSWPAENAQVPESCAQNIDCASPAFVLHRTGPTNTALAAYLQYSGTATPGVDYEALPTQIIFAEGQDTVYLALQPIDDTLIEGPETVVASFLPVPAPLYQEDPWHMQATITIVDDDLPQQPVVSIEAVSPISEESSEPYRRLPLIGSFRVSRTGATDNPLSVLLAYSGTATPGDDYELLPFVVTIPAGTNSTDIPVNPVIDNVPEGIETVTATLSNCPPPPIEIPCYAFGVDPTHSHAMVFIRDDGITEASVTIVAPTNSASFEYGQDIEMDARTVDLHGYINRAEFFADDGKIGESSIEFIRAPDPGDPVTIPFVWRDAPAGLHILTARALSSTGAALTSPPVQIRVSSSQPLPVVSVRTIDYFAVEPSLNSVLNTAAFRLHRVGPTNADLTVAYSLHGTAENGVDYEKLAGVATIPAGNSSVTVTIVPLADQLAEGIETVILRIEEQPQYQIGARRQAFALISDNLWMHATDNIRRLPGCVHLCFPAETGQQYRVEASDDLINWETVFIAIATDGTLHFVEEETQSFSNRFYRLIRDSGQLTAD